jgi:hypothetical protein
MTLKSIRLGMLAAAAICAQSVESKAQVAGIFDFTILRSCIQHTPGFDANFTNLGTFPAGTRTSEENGVLVLRKDGTGAMALTVTTIRTHASRLQPGARAVSIFEASPNCPVTYTTNADGSLRIEFTCSGTTIAGAGAGGTSSAPNVALRGRLTKRGDVMVLSTHDQGAIEILPYVEANGVSGTDYRICNRHGTAIAR